MVSKHVCGYEQKLTRIYDYGYTYDKRGNLVKEEEICSPTTTGPRNITIATYLYDETNRMVQGTNKAGEVSAYTFNGLGVPCRHGADPEGQQPRLHGLPLPDAQRGDRHRKAGSGQDGLCH